MLTANLAYSEPLSRKYEKIRAEGVEFSELETRQATSPQSCAILCSRSGRCPVDSGQVDTGHPTTTFR